MNGYVGIQRKKVPLFLPSHFQVLLHYSFNKGDWFRVKVLGGLLRSARGCSVFVLGLILPFVLVFGERGGVGDFWVGDLDVELKKIYVSD